MVAAPALGTPFVTSKWYLLEGLTALWLLVEVWCCGSRGLPSFVRERWLLSMLLAALLAGSTLRGGLGWGFAPLLDRLSCAALALCFFWYFRREGPRIQGLLAPVAVATAVAAVFGLTTLASRPEAPAFFGNPNLAAQFLGFGLLFLVFAPGPARGGVPFTLRGLLGLASGVYIGLLGTRSVALGLAAAALAAVVMRPPTLRRPATLVSAGAVAAVALAVLALAPRGQEGGPKTESVNARLAVWAATLEMIRDRPLGVGAANFFHAFLPYQAQGAYPLREGELFQTPHNEYLRVVAEDGIPVGVVAGVLLVLLLVRLRHRLVDRDAESVVFLVPMLAFLGIESFFQFPLAVASGATSAALLLGLALSVVEPGGSPWDRPVPQAQGRGASAWQLWISVTAGALLVALGLVVYSDHLSAGGGDDLHAQERACRLNPRNLAACVTAAWLRAGTGDSPGSRRLTEQVVGRAPYYPPAMKLLGELALLEGRDAEGCRILARYDALFVGQSSVRERLRRHCSDEPRRDASGSPRG